MIVKLQPRQNNSNKKTLKYSPRTVEIAFINLIKDLSKNNEVILLYPIPEIGINLQKKKI